MEKFYFELADDIPNFFVGTVSRKEWLSCSMVESKQVRLTHVPWRMLKMLIHRVFRQFKVSETPSPEAFFIFNSPECSSCLIFYVSMDPYVF